MRVLTALVIILWSILNVPAAAGGGGASQARGLTIEALENSAYRLNGTEVRLGNGRYVETRPESGKSLPPYDFMVELVAAALGDLNGDGISDAAVVLSWDGGGSGTFYYLAAVVDEGGTPVNVSTTYLGDGLGIRSVEISSGTITIDMLVRGLFDPMCCPSKRSRKEYRLIRRGGKYRLIP